MTCGDVQCATSQANFLQGNSSFRWSDWNSSEVVGCALPWHLHNSPPVAYKSQEVNEDLSCGFYPSKTESTNLMRWDFGKQLAVQLDARVSDYLRPSARVRILAFF
jgi:hypothetical protein